MYWFIVDRWAQKSKLSQKYLLSFTIASNVFEKKLFFFFSFPIRRKTTKGQSHNAIRSTFSGRILDLFVPPFFHRRSITRERSVNGIEMNP